MGYGWVLDPERRLGASEGSPTRKGRQNTDRVREPNPLCVGDLEPSLELRTQSIIGHSETMDAARNLPTPRFVAFNLPLSKPSIVGYRCTGMNPT
jgi:hypothetical protein